VALAKQLPEGLNVPERLRHLAETPLHPSYQAIARKLEKDIEGLSFLAPPVAEAVAEAEAEAEAESGIEEIRGYLEDLRPNKGIEEILNAIHRPAMPRLNVLRPCIHETLRVVSDLYRRNPPLPLEDKQELLETIANALNDLLTKDDLNPRIWLERLRDAIKGLAIFIDPIVHGAFQPLINRFHVGASRRKRRSKKRTRRH
jgi:hypothetical protein